MGVDGYWVERDLSYLVPQPSVIGLKSWSQDVVSANTSSIPTGSRVYLQRMAVPVDRIITNVHLAVITAGSGLTAGQNWMGVYNDQVTRIGVTADQTTNFALGPNAWITAPLTAPITVASDVAWIYTAFVTVGTTRPTIARSTDIASLMNGGVSNGTNGLRFGYINATNTTLPTSFSAASLVSATPFFGGVS